MRKMSCALLVLALLVGYHAATMEPASAQGKKASAEQGTIEINEGKDGKFRFNVRDSKGKLLAQSSLAGFASVKEAQAGVDRLKEVIATAKVAVGSKKDAKKDKDKD
jgi:uncharacterized protein YegP (UPF0339 family)